MSANLSPSATVRVFAAEPALSPSAGLALVAAIERLFVQFVREGRCTAAGAELVHEGRFVVVAWEGPAISGCSHDKLAQVVAAHERSAQVAMLAPPPIALGTPPQLVDRAGLRALLARGTVAGHTPWWNLRVATLGEWRAQPQTLAESPFAALAVAS
jgi:hypothetical protein